MANFKSKPNHMDMEIFTHFYICMEKLEIGIKKEKNGSYFSKIQIL